jgi:ABC-type multidrug transport system fused ATPase/permease subunit
MKLSMRRRTLRGFMLCFCIITCCFFAHIAVQAQEIKVSGGFLKDSIQIGEPVGYYLTAAYPQALTVLFPDSTYSFVPFEFERKKISPTYTAGGISRDSVVYFLSTFEIDKVQYLSLPVFVTSARDCTVYTPIADSIYLVELVTTLPPDSVSAQNLSLKTNTLYEKVISQFNFIILIISIVVLLVTAVIIWIVFGKRIRKYFKLKKLQKSHSKFIQAFTDQFQQLSTIFSSEKAETAISLWKKYLEQLEKRPYTKLTTRETIEMEPNEKLAINLKMIDRAIYGNQTSVNEPLEVLKNFAEERFQIKLEEVKNG